MNKYLIIIIITLLISVNFVSAQESNVLKDLWGNMISFFAVKKITTSQVTQNPAVLILYPSNYEIVKTSPFKVVGKSKYSSSVKIRLNGGQWQTVNGLADWDKTLILNLGTNIMEAQSCNNQMPELCSNPFTVNLKYKPNTPTISIINPKGKVNVVKTSPFRVLGKSKYSSSVKIRLNGGQWQTVNGLTDWDKTLILNSGVNKLEVQACNNQIPELCSDQKRIDLVYLPKLF